MNCANHPQNPVAAYCRTCGKPLCTNCMRPVMGVVYCETCLAERVGFTPPAPPPGSYPPYPPAAYPPGHGAGPSPGLAGILGAIPFGVGAVYNGQYAKGLVHLGIFVCLVVALSSNPSDALASALGIFMGFFCLYQVIDAVRTAKAIQAHQPPPDPFGLGTMFSPGPPGQPAASGFSPGRSIPAGALVLIVLGVLFLLHNLNVWFLRADVLWPLVLIGIGVWLLAKKIELSGGVSRCGGRGLIGPAVLITLGAQFLFSNLGVISFGRTLPLLLIVIGVLLAIEHSSPHSPGPPPPPPPLAPSSGPETPTTDLAPPPEVRNG